MPRIDEYPQFFDDNDEERERREQARCAGLTSLCYPDKEGSKDAKTAQSICQGTYEFNGVKQYNTPCPNLEWCKEQAIMRREQGIWGGTTTRQRKLEIRRRRAAKKAKKSS